MKEKFLLWVKETVLPILKEGAKNAFKMFIDFTWKNIRKDVLSYTSDKIGELSKFRVTKEYEDKKEIFVEALFNKIKLPFFASPFKRVIKKSLKKEIEKIVDEVIEKGSKITI